MAKAEYKPVTFLSAEGEEISNDPVWHAQRVLRQAGVETPQAAPKTAEEELEDDDESTGDYSEVKGEALVALAKEREISLKREDGTKLKAGEVREALVAQDAAK